MRSAAAIIALALAAPASTAQLRIEIRDVASSNGAIHIGVYNAAEAFPKDGRTFRSAVVPAQAPRSVAVFDDLPQGDYAVAVYHDENGNGKFDTNRIGLPLERYGFSRDARVFLGPPRFDDAKVPVGADREIIIHLR